MLEVSGLDVRYGPITAVRGIDLTAEAGTITAILGANGAGKSSLMKAISGLVPAAGGSVKLDGEDITRLPAHERARRGLSHALEGRRLFHRMTVEENLRVAWDFRSKGGSFRAVADRAYETFPMLTTRRHTPAGMLSGGQQQMVILSAALIHEPRYLLLDEPSLGLAPVIVQQIFGFIEAVCRERRTTIILCEQVAALALRVAHHGYVLRRGAVVQQGPAAALASDPSLSAAYLGN
ncbi:ABC transporter ATP-binding protein [Azospirillum sp.]|uniref:ABC transporter ATP-binding protein n=1 Tax=Azospirillum sp. TaxID=34012 RepID=UPI003D756CA3